MSPQGHRCFGDCRFGLLAGMVMRLRHPWLVAIIVISLKLPTGPDHLANCWICLKLRYMSESYLMLGFSFYTKSLMIFGFRMTGGFQARVALLSYLLIRP